MKLIDQIIREEEALRVEALRLALNQTQHSASTTAETLDLAQQFYRFLIGIKDNE